MKIICIVFQIFDFKLFFNFMELLCVQKFLQSLLTHFLRRFVLIYFLFLFFLNFILDFYDLFLAHLLQTVLHTHLDKLLPVDFSFILIHQYSDGVFVNSGLRSVFAHLLFLNLFLEQKFLVFILFTVVEKSFLNLG